MKRFLFLSLVVSLSSVTPEPVNAQFFGLESHNTLMPASGGMAGTSIARPQDNLSAINGNPATLMQMQGTQVGFGGAIIDADIHLTQTAPVGAAVTPFSAESNFPVVPIVNFGVTQELNVFDKPVTGGLGFFTNAGAGTDYVSTPASNGTAATAIFFEAVAGVGTQLTDRLSAGASAQLGIGLFDAPFVGISKTSLAYAPRGSFGINYDVAPHTTFGTYYQTKQSFSFDDAILLNLGGGLFSTARDVNLDLPRNVGFGIANTSLMNGDLLIAADLLWKNWEDTDALGALYNDQWVVQLGTQYSTGPYRFRLGYAWAENPLRATPDVSIGGVTPPGLLAAAQLVQAQVALINEHRITAGVGMVDLLPGVNLDIMGGLMLNDSQALGASFVDVQTYWIGFGLTWQLGACTDGCQ